MQRYFYVRFYAFDPTNTKITRLMGYFTDVNHNYFFPLMGISREEAVELIKARDVIFLEDGCYRKVFIKLTKIEGQEYLRVDHYPHPTDYLG
jgi:hypothetical protein